MMKLYPGAAMRYAVLATAARQNANKVRVSQTRPSRSRVDALDPMAEAASGKGPRRITGGSGRPSRPNQAVAFIGVATPNSTISFRFSRVFSKSRRIRFSSRSRSTALPSRLPGTEYSKSVVVSVPPSFGS